MRLTLKLEGFEELKRAFQEIPETARGKIRKALEDSYRLVVAQLAEYPSQRSGSRYKRTGTLRAAWLDGEEDNNFAFASEGGGGFAFTSKITNKATSPRGVAYAGYVQGAETQAWMHKGVWQTDGQVLQKNESAIQGKFEDALDQIAQELDQV